MKFPVWLIAAGLALAGGLAGSRWRPRRIAISSQATKPPNQGSAGPERSHPALCQVRPAAHRSDQVAAFEG